LAAMPEARWEHHSSIEDVLQAISVNQPSLDLIVCEEDLPDGTALDLLAALRQIGWDIPFIVAAVNHDDPGAMQTLRQRVDDYLVHGAHFAQQLPDAVCSALGRRANLASQARHQIHVLHLRARAGGITTHPALAETSSRIRYTHTHDLPRARRLLMGTQFDVLLIEVDKLPGVFEFVGQARRHMALDTPIILVSDQLGTPGDHDFRVGALKWISRDAHFDARLPLLLEDIWLKHTLIKERQQLRDIQDALHRSFAEVGQAFWLLDAHSHQPQYFSPSFAELFGVAREALDRDGWVWVSTLHPCDREALEAPQRFMRGLAFEVEVRVLHPDAGIRHVALSGHPLPDAMGRINRVACIARDVTQHRLQQVRMSHLAYHDPLTNLPNRALLLDRLSHAVAQAQRNFSRLAVMFVDIDRFKEINDSLGHQAGDVLLRTVATRLRSILREADTVARMGGDEFVILLSTISGHGDPKLVAEKLMRVVSAPIDVEGHRVDVTASVGIALFPQHGRQPDELLRHADSALYQAKASGRNGYLLFNPNMVDSQIGTGTSFARR
jgi:diguanylate cyclase (GGDEF)-like protein/PAS domain S-box-containing protein